MRGSFERERKKRKSTVAVSVAARRLHQREQFVDRLLRDRAHTIGLVHAGDVDAFHDGFDLVAKVGEEAQGITLLVGDTCDQSRDQDLTSDPAS